MRARSLSCVVVLVLVANIAHATPVLDKPPFTATPAELLGAAKAAPRGGSDVVVLRDENDVAYDERGRITSRWRYVFVVVTQAGADDWNTLTSSWRPSYQDKPTVRARVIDANGRVTDLDASRITEAPVGNAARALPGDRRRLEVPLPPLAVGSVVEEEVVLTDREPLLAGGAGFAVNFGGAAPVASTVIRYSSPASRKLRFLAHNLPAGTKPKTETVGGRQITTYVLGSLPGNDDFERYVPGDARPYRYVMASPVASWSAVAREYRSLVDKQIAAGPFALPAELPKTASLDAARAIVAWLHKNITYSGVAVDDSAVVPATPAEIVKRGHASMLDSATLLVALLRQAGMQAELALINVGPGPDLDRELPALNAFDHALVRARIGKTEVWIDPIEQLTQPGKLPALDQGRFALVVADATTALITTPVAAASELTIREVRTFELAEGGYAKVTEVSREGGVFEPEQRSWIRDTAPDAVRKQLASYAESEYGGTLVSYTSTAPDDLTKPFEVTVVSDRVRRAYSGREEIEIYLWPTDTFKKLPEPLGSPQADERARKHDFKLHAPHTYEIENRLVVPVGFTMPAAARDKTRELGPFKLVEKQRVDGQTLVVTFRLEATKARLTPAEVTKLQQAVRALRQEDAVRVVISQAALALADKGTYRDAIAETNKLIKLHPKEALHHQQLAQVLMKAGAGAAARRAIKKALELEPTNADVHVMFAWIIQHDTFGTWLGFDHDHAAAVAALRKARKLDPQHVGAASDLAAALELDAHGRRFELGVDVRGAIEAWRAARTLDDTSDNAYGLAIALVWAGELAEAEKVLRSMRSEERRDQLLIVVTALTAGPEAAARYAASVGSGTKVKNLTAAAGMLMLLRRYDGMRALFAEASLMQAGSPQALLAQKLARIDKPFKPTSDPRDIALEMSLGHLYDRKTNVYWDKVTRDEIYQPSKQSLGTLKRTDLMTTPLVEDIVRSAGTLSVEGDKGLWRVEHDMFGSKSKVYVAADRGTPKVIALAEFPRGAGRHVLRLLAKNDEKSAQRLLDWVAQDLAARQRKDQLSHAFDKLWGGNLPRTRAAMEVAAAALAGKTEAARGVPILASCKPTTTDGQLACDWELADLYRDTAQWGELEEHAREWLTRAPKQLNVPAVSQAMALARLGRFDEADKLIADMLARDPDNRGLLYTYADIAIGRGQLAEGIRRVESLTKQASPQPGDLNNVAWLKLGEASDLQGAATLARKGVQLAPNEPHLLNTLAAIEAELGELGPARQHLAQSIQAKQEARPGDADTYVQARILEQLGLTDDAIALYRQVTATSTTSFTPESSDFAARRLKALGVKK